MRKVTKVCETWKLQRTHIGKRDLESFQSPTGLNPGNKPVYYVIKLRQIFEDLCRGDSELIDTIR